MRRTQHVAILMVALLSIVAVLPVTAATPTGKVNINTASAEQLQLLPRVGPSVAQRIIDFRKSNGAFKSAEDLMLVRGVGEATFARLKPYVSISGETTLKDKVHSPSRSSSEH